MEILEAARDAEQSTTFSQRDGPSVTRHGGTISADAHSPGVTVRRAGCACCGRCGAGQPRPESYAALANHPASPKPKSGVARSNAPALHRGCMAGLDGLDGLDRRTGLLLETRTTWLPRPSCEHLLATAGDCWRLLAAVHCSRDHAGTHDVGTAPAGTAAQLEGRKMRTRECWRMRGIWQAAVCIPAAKLLEAPSTVCFPSDPAQLLVVT